MARAVRPKVEPSQKPCGLVIVPLSVPPLRNGITYKFSNLPSLKANREPRARHHTRAGNDPILTGLTPA